MIFGKKLSDYIRFQRVILGLILVVGLVKLGLSLAGVSDAMTKWLSITVLSLVGVFYYGVRVHTTGFGSYKQLLPLVFNQNVMAHGIAVIGIAIAMLAGRDNVFTLQDYGGRTWGHALNHVILGMFVASFLGWLVASIVMWVTKRVARRPAPAPA